MALPVLSLEIALKLCDRVNFAMYGIKRESQSTTRTSKRPRGVVPWGETNS